MTKRYFTSPFQQPFVGVVDLLNANHFHVGGNAVFAAEVEHFLRFGNAADAGAGEAAPQQQQIEHRKWGSGFSGARPYRAFASSFRSWRSRVDIDIAARETASRMKSKLAVWALISSIFFENDNFMRRGVFHP